jgi:hypothetical protein
VSSDQLASKASFFDLNLSAESNRDTSYANAPKNSATVFNVVNPAQVILLYGAVTAVGTSSLIFPTDRSVKMANSSEMH